MGTPRPRAWGCIAEARRARSAAGTLGSSRRRARAQRARRPLIAAMLAGFAEVLVEAGLARLGAVGRLREARERDEEDAAQLGIGAEGARHRVPVHARHAHVAQDEVRLEGARQGEALVAVVGHGHLVRVDLERELEAVGDVAIVVDDEHAAAAGLARRRGAGRGVASARPSSGSRTTKVAPRPCPSLRASMSPPCSSTSPRASASPRPSPPPARSSVRSACTNGLEDAGQERGLDAAARVGDGDDGGVALRGERHGRAAARRRELGGVRQEVPDDLRDANGVDAGEQRPGGHARLEANAAQLELPRGCPRWPRARAARDRPAVRWSWILFCESRVTSRRSSTRCARCPTWRSMRPRAASRCARAGVLGRGVLALEDVEARADRRRAGCAARARGRR